MVEFERGYPRTPGVYLIKDYGGEKYGLYLLAQDDDPYDGTVLISDYPNFMGTCSFDVSECEYLLIEE